MKTMKWIMSEERLPETSNETIDDENGVHKESDLCLVATKNGGFYVGYLELRKFPKCKKWTETWYVSSVQDDGIDCDGVEIHNVIAWIELPTKTFRRPCR